MFVYLKQSGELLAAQGQSGDLWTADGVRSSADKIRAAYDRRDDLDISGLQIVSGAGNIIRGNQLADTQIGGSYRDVIGRLATIQNTIILAEALDYRRVPVSVFVADNMDFVDPSLSGMELHPFSVEAALEAYDQARVVLVAGGTGEDDKTTDNAVLEYARRHTEARPDDDVLVLKGTKHDGVYEDDPQTHTKARRYQTIGAPFMLRNYERFGVVDEACLQQIALTGIAMRIYRDGQHDLGTALGRESGHVGTLVVAEDADPVFAD